MSDYLQKIVELLYVIHQENMVLVKALFREGKSKEIAEQCEEVFESVLDGEIGT